MTTNEGTLDRALRAALGLALLILALATSALSAPILQWAAIIAGAVLLITAATGFCPLYRIVGIRTCRTR